MPDARKKGHRAELEFLADFKEDFPFARTSREASRLYDSCKIDLWGLPFLIQIKAGYKNGINATQILNDMQEGLNNNFPSDALEHTYPQIIIQKKDKSTRVGTPRAENDTIVYMSYNTFKKLYKPYANSINQRTAGRISDESSSQSELPETVPTSI